MARKKKEEKVVKEYLVKLNERQLRLILAAVEEWGRLRMGQTWGLSDDLAFQHYEYGKEATPSGEREFNRRIYRRDACRELLDLAMRAASGGDYFDHFQKTEDVDVALDMYATIRNFFWNEEPEDKRRAWTVDANPLYLFGSEPKMEIERVKDDG